MRFLICGVGSVGTRHLRNLEALGQQDIVLLRSGKGTLRLEELEGYSAEQDLRRALERWSPDAVIVTNPTALHLEIAIPAARAGCHLLVEKPISHSMERVAELRRALGEGGGRLLVGFQYRHHPGLRTARQLISEGTLGRALSARAHYGDYLPDWHPWEDYRSSYSARADLGGGALLTLCHAFDYLRWILGEVETLAAHTGHSSMLELQVEELAEVVMTHTGGIVSSVHLDYHQRPPQHWLEVVCERGTIRWDQESGSTTWWTAEDERWHRQHPPKGYDRNQMFLDEMRHFVQLALGEAEPACTLEDGIAALQIALAARRSAESGRRVKL